MNRGQVAFESLILLLVIISATIYITGLFFSTQDTTIAYSIARTRLVEQASSSEKDFVIDTINLEINQTNNLYITTIPQNIKNNDFNLNIIEEEIVNNTSFNEIIMKIN